MIGKFFPRVRPAPFRQILVPRLLAGCGHNDAPDDGLEAVRASGIARLVAAEEALSAEHEQLRRIILTFQQWETRG